jgi:hypothetical protein
MNHSWFEPRVRLMATFVLFPKPRRLGNGGPSANNPITFLGFTRDQPHLRKTPRKSCRPWHSQPLQLRSPT